MNGLRMLLFKMWMKRRSLEWEARFLRRLEQEQRKIQAAWYRTVQVDENGDPYVLRQG